VLPDLVPARMVNEYVYCPRLFFLEWVQSRFADNDDTVEGRYQHRRVDRECGAVADPREEAPFRARSVSVSSASLGLVARMDLLESDGSRVTPVDYKRGRPPVNAHRAWDPERVQLCVQGLILREAGYRCDGGILYFAETRERVDVPFDDDLVRRTLQAVIGLREVAEQDTPPPPLVDSPKCPRCSLVGLCLPDETNLLAERTLSTPRRLVPRDESASPVYVTEQGAYLGHREGRMTISRNGGVIGDVRLLDVSQLNVYGNVQVSTQLLGKLFEREVPTCWFSHGGWFRGIAHGLPSKHVELRRRQVAGAAQGGLAIARAMIEGKIRNSRTLLRRNARDDVDDQVRQLATIATSAAHAQSVAELLGLEGAAARIYFEAFGRMLKTELPGGTYTFEGRKRRPPPDPINALLSFVYALLVKDLTITALAVGFDPYLGFYHRPRFGRPALALDLMEEFRPLIAESVVVQVVNNGEVRPSQFIVRAGGVALNRAGRQAVLEAYQRRLATEVRHPTFGYRITYRRVLEVQARVLGAHLLGEVPAYVAFKTR
jgi:CRISP-associated protein Cas1